MEPFNEQLAPEPIEEQPTQSAIGRYFNVLASPSEAFNGIVSLEKKAILWLVPLLIAIVVAVGSSELIMSNPAIQQDIRSKTEESYQKMVQSGKLTQEQADKAMEMQSPGMRRIFSDLGITLGVPLVWLLLAGVYFLVMSFVLGGETTFLNIYVVYSLASAVTIIESIVGALLKYATASLTTDVSLSFLVSSDSSPALHTLLGKLDPFTFWWMAVLSIGFAKVSNLEPKKAAIGVVGLWALYSGVSVWLSTMDFAKSFMF